MKLTKPVLRRPNFGNLVARLMKHFAFSLCKTSANYSCSIMAGPYYHGSTPSEAIEAALKDAEGK